MIKRGLLFSSILLALVVATLPFMTACAKEEPAPTTTPTPAPAPEKVYKFRLEAFYPPSEEMYSIGLAEYVKRIKEATKGRIEITLYSGGTLVPSTEIFKSVSEGIIDMGLGSTSYWSGIMPFSDIPEGMPMSWRNAADAYQCLWERGLADLIQQEYEKREVHFVNGAISGITLLMVKKPLRTQADFQGTKIRGYGVWNNWLGKLGASPVTVPLPDVYMGLSTGTFDGAISGASAWYSMKIYEVAKYIEKPFPRNGSVHDIMINLKTWNALPDDLKSVVTSTARDFDKWHTTDYDKKYQQAYIDKLVAQGVTLVDVEPATWDWMQAKAMEQWADVAAKDAVAAKAVKIMTDYFKEKGYIK